MRRYWEAHDLIIEAMSTDGPFNWEGEYFTTATSASGRARCEADAADLMTGLSVDTADWQRRRVTWWDAASGNVAKPC
jgi:hypothetical protein